MVYSLESGWLLNYDVKSTELYCHVANKSMEELGWDFFGPLGFCSWFQHRRNFPLSCHNEIFSLVSLTFNLRQLLLLLLLILFMIITTL